MDFKRLLPFLLLSMAAIIFWPMIMSWIARTQGWQTAQDRARIAATRPTTQQTSLPQPTNDPAGLSGSQISQTSPTTLPVTDITRNSAGSLAVIQNETVEQILTLGATSIEQTSRKERAQSPWAMSLALTNVGAGVQQVQLASYRRDLRTDAPYTFATGEAGFERFTRPLATRWVEINGQRVDLTNAVWTVADSSLDSADQQQTVRYELTLTQDGTPALKLAKTYTLFNRTVKLKELGEGPEGYEVLTRYDLTNLGGQPLVVSLLTNGPNCPPAEAERMPDRQIIGGYDIADGRVRIEHKYTDQVADLPWELTQHPNGYRFLWVTGSTVYFNAMVRPEPITGAFADWVKSVRAVTLTPQLYGAQRAVGTVIETNPLTIAAGQSTRVGFASYFGPRKREVLGNSYFSRPYMEYAASLVIAAWPCGFCTFTWLIDILFFILKAFHTVLRDWGLAIIGLVVLVRLCLHPITKRSQLSMMKLGKLGPKLAEIKEKYGDNKEEMNKAMMEFYRQQGASPFLGCLPMFLQMPIWIALWQALQTTFDLRHAPAFYGLTWINDLSKPDHLIDFADYGWGVLHVPLLPFTTISGLNILPLLMGIIMYWQIRTQPKPPSMTPEQEQQQKIVQWMMIIMMPIFLYGSPSGLCLYIITSTLLGIWESKIVRRQFEAQEAEAAKFKLVEGELVKPALAGAGKSAKPSDRKRPAGKLAGFFYDLNLKAQQMREELEKQQNLNQKRRKK